MSDLFVFDVDNFLGAGKPANFAKNLAGSGAPVANDLLTVANVSANPQHGRPTLADISNSLASENQPQEPTLAGLATLATGQTAENDFSFSRAFPILALPTEQERLITLVATHYCCTPAEVEEIREAASRDIDGALTAYRAMAAEIGRPDDEEAQALAAGMALCRECSRLVAGQCLAAREGRIKGAAREYRPVQGVFRRCKEYHARPYLNQSKVTNSAAIGNQPESLTEQGIQPF